MSLPKVAVVILNWNGIDLLKHFLPYVLQHSSSNRDFIVEVVLADNASTDASVAYTKEHFPAVQIVINPMNNGYAGGYNTALKHIKADVYVLVNSDIEVTDNWLQEPVMQMLCNPKIACVQPKICSFSKRNLLEYAGGAGGFIDRLGYPFCRGRIFDTQEEDHKQYNNYSEIFWASGACMFIRSDCFWQAGGFDEDFFAHMEEIDLCWRLKNLGYLCMYEPASVVYHVGGGTLSAINPRKTYLNFRNNLYMLAKNLPSPFFTRTIFLRLVLDGIAAWKFLLQGSFRHFKAVFDAHMSFYANFRKMMAKRQRNESLKKSFKLSAVYRRSIVFDYFVLGRKKFNALRTKDFYP